MITPLRSIRVVLLVAAWSWISAAGVHLSDRPDPLPPPPGTADHRDKDRLLFLVFGDSGSGTKKQLAVGSQMANVCEVRGGCDFALMAGDNLYESGASADYASDFKPKFETPYERLGEMDFWAVPGNHDWRTRGSVDREVRYTNESPRWRMLSHDYAVPRLPEWIRIYGLATTKLQHGLTDGQVARARETLCPADGWKFLLGHHPIYSSGPHADSAGENPSIKERLLTPLIEACGVHLYLSGHDHHQEHLSAPAFDQLVQGAAGRLRKLRRVKKRDPQVRQLTAEPRLGFALVEATPDHLILRFFGYGRDDPGEFYCRFYERAAFGDLDERSVPCPGE